MLNIVPFAFFSVVMGFTLDLNSLSIVFCSTLLQVPLAKTYREMKSEQGSNCFFWIYKLNHCILQGVNLLKLNYKSSRYRVLRHLKFKTKTFSD